ncbi:MAG: hypothetical protein LBE18_01700, partial [Planctomycetaceae bacterium]|nr:hypothetical protein [Planctomycetaceae bacterium]
MKSGKSNNLYFLLRSIIVLVTIIIFSFCVNQKSAAQNNIEPTKVYLVYPSFDSIPYNLRAYYPDLSGRFLIQEDPINGSLYFPPPRIRLSSEGDWFIAPLEPDAEKYYPLYSTSTSNYTYNSDINRITFDMAKYAGVNYGGQFDFSRPQKGLGQFIKAGKGTIRLENLYDDTDFQAGIIVRGGILETGDYDFYSGNILSYFNMTTLFNAVIGNDYKTEWKHGGNLYVGSNTNPDGDGALFTISKGGLATIGMIDDASPSSYYYSVSRNESNLGLNIGMTYNANDNNYTPSTGRVLIDGKGSKLTAYYLRMEGTSYLDISNGGIANFPIQNEISSSSYYSSSTPNYRINIGQNAGSKGVINVVGAGSIVSTQLPITSTTSTYQYGDLIIGGAGFGVLNLVDGGRAEVGDFNPYSSYNGESTVTVSGGAALLVKDNLYLRNGTVSLTDRGSLEANRIYAGYDSYEPRSLSLSQFSSLTANNVTIDNHSTITNLQSTFSVLNQLDILHGKLNVLHAANTNALNLSLTSLTEGTSTSAPFNLINVAGASSHLYAGTAYIGIAYKYDNDEDMPIQSMAMINISDQGNISSGQNIYINSFYYNDPSRRQYDDSNEYAALNVAGRGSSVNVNNIRVRGAHSILNLTSNSSLTSHLLKSDTVYASINAATSSISSDYIHILSGSRFNAIGSEITLTGSETTSNYGFTINGRSDANIVNSRMYFDDASSFYIGMSGDGVLNLLNTSIDISQAEKDDGNDADNPFNITIGSTSGGFGIVNIWNGNLNLQGGDFNLVNGRVLLDGTITTGGLNTSSTTSSLIVLKDATIRTNEKFAQLDSLVGGNGTIYASGITPPDLALHGGYRTVLGDNSILYAGDYKGDVGILTFAGQLDLGNSPYFRVDLSSSASDATADLIKVINNNIVDPNPDPRPQYVYPDVGLHGDITVDLTSLILNNTESESTQTILEIDSTNTVYITRNLPAASNNYSRDRTLPYDMDATSWTFLLNGESIVDAMGGFYENNSLRYWLGRIKRNANTDNDSKYDDYIYGRVGYEQLQIHFSNLNYQNLVLRWRGNVDTDANPATYANGGVNLDWNLTNRNWDGTNESGYGESGRFLDGDAVIFDNTGGYWIGDNNPRNFIIELGGTGKTVAQITVNDVNQLTLRGNILADGTKTTLTALNETTGKLFVIDSTLRLEGYNEFLGGIDLTNSTIELGRDSALGTYIHDYKTDAGILNVLANDTATGRSVIRISSERSDDSITASNRFVALADNDDVSTNLIFHIPQSISEDGNYYYIKKLTIENVRGASAIEVGKGNDLYFTGSRDFAMRNNTSDIGGAILIGAGSQLLSYGNASVPALGVTNGLSHLRSFILSNNYASVNGGAIAYLNETVPLIFYNDVITLFENNIAVQNGGAIYSSSEVKFLDDTTPNYRAITFTGNIAVGGGGGAIYAPTVTIDEFDVSSSILDNLSANSSVITFTGNSAADGGAIYTETLTPIKGIAVFNGNTASNSGGALYVKPDNPIAGGWKLLDNSGEAFGNVTFNGNEAGEGGGGAIYTTNNLIIETFVAKNPTPPDTTPGLTDLIGTNFTGNKSIGPGGAIYIDNPNGQGKVTLSGSNLFASNESIRNNGGAIYADSLTINDLKTDSTHGTNPITSSNTSFLNNRALNGGAFYGHELIVSGNTSFIDNESIEDGGAVYITDGGTVTLNAGTGDIAFTNNRSFSTKGRSPNSLFLVSNVNLTLNGNHNFYFDDPIYSTSTDGGNSLTKTGEGFVQFIGNTVLNAIDAQTAGNVSINGGTFRLAGLTPANVSSFTTNGNITFADNTILAGQGILAADQIKFGNEVWLTPDNDRFETPGGIGFAGATPGRDSITYSKTTISSSASSLSPNITYSKAIGTYIFDADVEFGKDITYTIDLSDDYVLDTRPELNDTLKEQIENYVVELYKKTIYQDEDDINKELLPRVDFNFKQSDDILIVGNISHSNPGGADPNQVYIKIDLNNWVDGTFELMRSYADDLNNDIDPNNKKMSGQLLLEWFTDNDAAADNIELTISGLPIGSRQIARLYVENNVQDPNDPYGTDYNRLILVMNTAFGNKDLLWTGLKSNNQWDTTTSNWRWYWTTDEEKYNPNDYVIFDGVGRDRSDINLETKVQVSGMLIMGGWESFISKGGEKNEGEIVGKLLRKNVRTIDGQDAIPTINTFIANYGQNIDEYYAYYDQDIITNFANSNYSIPENLTLKMLDNNGQTVTGRLDISTPSTESITEFHIPTTFEKGTQIHGNGTIILGHNNALGKLTNGLEDPTFNPTAYRDIAKIIQFYNFVNDYFYEINGVIDNPIITHENYYDILSEIQIASNLNDQSGMIYIYDFPKELQDENDIIINNDPITYSTIPQTVVIKSAESTAEQKLVTSNWFYVAPSIPPSTETTNSTEPRHNVTLEAGDGTTWTITGNDGDIASQKARWDLQAREERYSTKDETFELNDITLVPNPTIAVVSGGPYSNGTNFQLQWSDVYAGVLFLGSSSDLNIKGNLSFIDNIAPAYNNTTLGYGAIHLNGNNILNFDTTNGDILFDNNYYNYINAQGELEQERLAISFNNNSINPNDPTSNTIINFTGINTGGVFFNDPIRPIDPANPNNKAAININFSNNDSFVQFRGENILRNGITVEGGVMRIANYTDNTESSINAGNSLFIGNKGVLSGNGTITADKTEIVGVISPDSTILSPDNHIVGNSKIKDPLLPAEVGTLTFIGDMTFYDAEFNIDIALNSENKTVNDKIIVTGDIIFGNNETRVNTINLDDWIGPAKYTIMEADFISQVDDSWIIKYHGATLDYVAVNSDYEDYEISSDIRVALAVIRQEKLILQLRSGTVFGNVIQWDGSDWTNNNITADNLIVLNNSTPNDIITVDADNMLFGGLEVYNKRFELQSITRDDIGTIRIVESSQLQQLTASGKVYVHSSGELYTNIPIDAQQGVLLENLGAGQGGGTIIFGVQDAFGKYQEAYRDEANSPGRITAIGTDNKIIIDATINAQNRIVVEKNAELEIIVNAGEALTLSNVSTTANGAAISVTGDGTGTALGLVLSGNITITNNKSYYYVEQIPASNVGSSASLAPLTKPITTQSGIGAAIYLEDAVMVFDTTNGPIQILNNQDEKGINSMILVGTN